MAISLASHNFGQSVPTHSLKFSATAAQKREAIIESTTAYGLILADVAAFPSGWASPLDGFEKNVSKIRDEFHSEIQARAIAVCMFAKGYHGQDLERSMVSDAEIAIYDFAAAWRKSGYNMPGETLCACGVTSECVPILFANGFGRYI